MTHINNLGQACDGRFCNDCGKCESCSTKAKRLVAIHGRSHFPHTYPGDPKPRAATPRRSR